MPAVMWYVFFVSPDFWAGESAGQASFPAWERGGHSTELGVWAHKMSARNEPSEECSVW